MAVRRVEVVEQRRRVRSREVAAAAAAARVDTPAEGRREGVGSPEVVPNTPEKQPRGRFRHKQTHPSVFVKSILITIQAEINVRVTFFISLLPEFMTPVPLER